MVEHESSKWLVLDGYEDEPAAFGVPPYVGFHIRYLCGVLENHGIDYQYMTIDQWRNLLRASDQTPERLLRNIAGFACIAGAVVPGKYLRGTPVSINEINEIIQFLPNNVPAILGGWAIRGWRHQGWNPLRKNLFLSLQDTDATLDYFLRHDTWKHCRRTAAQWTQWAHFGANSQAVRLHPDLGDEGSPGPLTFEVEVYQAACGINGDASFVSSRKKVFLSGGLQKI